LGEQGGGRQVALIIPSILVTAAQSTEFSRRPPA
jgi:hypothetical protein